MTAKVQNHSKALNNLKHNSLVRIGQVYKQDMYLLQGWSTDVADWCLVEGLQVKAAAASQSKN